MALSLSVSNQIPNIDLLTWIFGGPEYDENKVIYIDALDETRRLTYSQAKSHVRMLVCGFISHGIKSADVVLVHSFCDIMYPILFLGIIGSGASFVGSNPSSTPEELSHTLSRASVSYIITTPRQLPEIISANSTLPAPIPNRNIFIFNTVHNPDIPLGFQSWETLLQYGELPWKCLSGIASQMTTVSLFATSGTTGLPKLAAVSHYATIARCIASHDTSTKPYSVSRLICLPMFHGFAASASHIEPLRYGYPSYILPRFSIDPFVESINKFQITETAMVPAVVSMILNTDDDKHKMVKEAFSSLRLIRCAGAPLDLSVRNAFKHLLDQEASISSAWGLTEFGSVTGFEWGEKDGTGSCGRLLPHVEIRIIDANCKDVHEDEIQGEVLLRGPTMMSGYLDNAEATEMEFVDGWLKSGDIAYHREGKWYIVGRSKDMIKVRGWQVAPGELESCLLQHPMVIEVAVIGIRSNTLDGEVPRAYVVRKKMRGFEEVDVTEYDLKDFLGTRLATYKALDGGVKFVGSLPKTASGKVLKRILREEAARETQYSQS